MIARTIWLVGICCCLMVANKAFAQEDTDSDDKLNELLETLRQYQSDYPREKVYLQFDKNNYTAGEDIWFKAYTTVSQFNFLSAISKILYVELINSENDIVLSRRLPVVSGMSVGDFSLPDSLPDGNYRIRAYTNWMRNFDESLFFEHNLLIAGSESDGILTASKFRVYTDDKKREILSATINLSNIEGAAVANREVAYEIRLDPKSTAKGKAKSDASGRVSIDFASKEGLSVRKGLIVLHIMNNDGPPVTKRIAIRVSEDRPSIEFYPESGVLLSGETNRVGFSAMMPNGQAQEVQGSIHDSQGEEVAVFNSNRTGVGSFSFIPESGEQYIARAEIGSEGHHVEIELPAIQDSGVQLAVRPEDDGGFLIQAVLKGGDLSGKQLALIAQNNGQVFYAVKSRTETDRLNVRIKAGQLPSGVTRLALFDPEMNLLAERSIFTQNSQDFIALQVTPDSNEYNPRNRVLLDLETGAPEDTARVGVYSLAVTHLFDVQDSVKKNAGITTSLLLNSDIQHPIEDPSFYAIGEQSFRKDEVDELMLLQESNPIFWENMLAGKMPDIQHRAEKQLRLSGRVTNKDGEPLEKAQVTLLSLQNTNAILDTLTNADGRFAFDKILFYDSTNFVVQARDARGRKNVLIELDDVPSQKISKRENAPEITVDANQNVGRYQPDSGATLDDWQASGFDERSIVLDEVKVEAKKENPARYSSNLNGPGRADQIISGNEIYFDGCPTLDVCLAGRLVGVMFRGRVPYSMRSPNRPMQIILDGVYMGPDALNIVQPFDVASIEILRTIGNTAIYGAWGGGGVMIITTRRGDQPRQFGPSLNTPGITTFSPQGYYAVREFYSPDYTDPSQQDETPDNRSTIHWENDIITDEEGKASVSFFTADQPGVYQIVVEGLDTEGRLARKVQFVEVR